MVYIHRETLDIIATDLQRIMQSNDYFAVDDLIAPTIQILNRKGYITNFCCSGHPFTFVTEGYMHDDTERKIFESRGDSCSSYISFDEGITLPILPPGWVIDDFENRWLIIRKYDYAYYANSFELSRLIFEAMAQLYQWAFYLPELRTI